MVSGRVENEYLIDIKYSYSALTVILSKAAMLKERSELIICLSDNYNVRLSRRVRFLFEL